MTKLFNLLSGKKTYAFAFAGAVVAFLWFAGVIDDKLAQMLFGLFGFGGLAALRNGLSKSE